MKETLLTVLLVILGALPASGDVKCQPILQPNPHRGGQFGCSVNIHNGDLAIGANLDGAGSVTLCPRGASGPPKCQQILPADGQPGDEFGRSVAVDENWLIVGAPFANGFGVVYVYQRDGGLLTFKQKLTVSDAARGDQFGITLGLSNDTLIVGAPNNVGTTGSLSGAVYVFHLDGGEWKQGQKLTAGDARAFDNFGFSLAIDGKIIVVGAPFQDGVGASSGEAYVFEWNGTTWSQRARLTASDAAAGDEYGSAVALSGNSLAVGARRDDVRGMQDAGSAYVYERPDSNSAWREVAHLFGQAAGDQFGVAASMSGGRLLIGALLHDGNDLDSGAAYLFQRSDRTGEWAQDGNPYLGTAKEDRFGQAVSIHEGSFLIGAYLADSGSIQDAGSAMKCEDKPAQHQFTVVKNDNKKEVSPGETLNYSITVTNTGTQAASAVEVTDSFSAKLRDVSWCVPGGQPDCVRPQMGNIQKTISLSPQGSVTFTATATVRLNARGVITNEACAQVPGEDKFCGHDDPPDEIQVPTPCPPDLELTKAGPASAKPGETITYTLTVINHGSCTATGVRIEDPIPAGLEIPGPPAPKAGGCTPVDGKIVCNLSDLPAHGSAAVSLPFTVLETCLPSIVNQATVSANEEGPVSSNQVSTTVVGTADLSLLKTVQPGDPIGYTLTITNLGPDIACGVVVSDPIPAGLTSPVLPPGCAVVGNEVRCSIAELPAGDFSKLSVSLTALAPCGSQITNTATASVSPPSVDPQHGNDSATATTTVGGALSITKTDGLTTASPGDTLSYTIGVGNPGQCPVTVRDVCPTGLTQFRWCRDSGGPCTPSRPGPVLEDALTDSTATYRVQGVVSPMFTGTLANTASVTGPFGSAQATDTTEIVLAPGVTAFCKGIDGLFLEGETITYTFLLLNGGPAAQMDNPGDEFSDLLPPGLTVVSASASSGVAVAGNPVTWNGAIPVGGMVTITISVKINAGTAGMTICNQAAVAFDRDGDGINESSGVSDDAEIPGPGDPCCFRVLTPHEIPTLSEPWLATLALLLALLALRRLRRRAL